jgi:hypothetical protein
VLGLGRNCKGHPPVYIQTSQSTDEAKGANVRGQNNRGMNLSINALHHISICTYIVVA